MDESVERHREEATDLTARLFEAAGRRREPEIGGLREGLWVADVRDDVAEFLADARLLHAAGLPFPMLRGEGDNTLVPVALRNFSPASAPGFPRLLSEFPHFELYLRELIRQLDEAPPSDRLALVATEKATDMFRDSVISFLATRIASVVDYFRGDSAPAGGTSAVSVWAPLAWLSRSRVKTVGFNVTVHSSPNLRIHCSRLTLIAWSYWGAPSTPTVNTLPGGIYKFGADGGIYGSNVQPDSADFDIPYKTVAPVLNL